MSPTHAAAATQRRSQLWKFCVLCASVGMDPPPPWCNAGTLGQMVKQEIPAKPTFESSPGQVCDKGVVECSRNNSVAQQLCLELCCVAMFIPDAPSRCSCDTSVKQTDVFSSWPNCPHLSALTDADTIRRDRGNIDGDKVKCVPTASLTGVRICRWAAMVADIMMGESCTLLNRGLSSVQKVSLYHSMLLRGASWGKIIEQAILDPGAAGQRLSMRAMAE